jgi:phospholipase/carboxylesterase
MSEASEAEERSLEAQFPFYYDQQLPETRPAPLLIALHGYGANKRQMMREARKFAPPNFAIVSLQGIHQHLKDPRQPGGPLRFGFGWLTNFHPEDSVKLHHQMVIRVIKKLRGEGLVDPERIFLLGFSQSCALNYRFAFTHTEYLKGVVGICGGIPGDWETSELYKPTTAAVFHLTGARDDFYPPSRVADYALRLTLRAAEVKFETYDAAHEIVETMRGDIHEWLLEYSK